MFSFGTGFFVGFRVGLNQPGTRPCQDQKKTFNAIVHRNNRNGCAEIHMNFCETL